MAIYILHRLVYSARLFMKMASWGFCVLVFESSGELGDRPQKTECRLPYSSGTKFDVRRSTPMRRLLALRQVLPWRILQVCSMSVLYFGKFATIHYKLSFPSAASDGPCFSETGDVSTEAEVRHMRRRKQAVITRRLVPLSGQEPSPVDVGSHERSRVMLEQAFDDGNTVFKCGYFGFGSLWVPHLLNCLDHFAVDSAITPVRATGHQLVTLCRSVCAEERAQILNPLMGSKCLTMCCYSF